MKKESRFDKLDRLLESIIQTKIEEEVKNDDIAEYIIANMISGTVNDEVIVTSAENQAREISKQIAKDGNKLTSTSMQLIQNLVATLIRSIDLDKIDKSLPSTGSSTTQNSPAYTSGQRVNATVDNMRPSEIENVITHAASVLNQKEPQRLRRVTRTIQDPEKLASQSEENK